MDLSEILNRHLQTDGTGWSMGSFGAIAEFHRDPGEAFSSDASQPATCVTARGGIRLERAADAVPVVYETPSAKPHRWAHGMALCLPADRAAMNGRCAITEIGPDREALRPGDRDAILFDIGICAAGVHQRYADFCVRTEDAELIGALRAGCGRSFLDRDNPAMAAIFAKNPHRVVLTALGRIEVYQPIGGPASQNRSPPGPHTHVLPKLMASGRLHSAIIPIPDGLVACATMYPGNPVMSALGEERDFDPALHDAFQQLFWQWGAPAQREAKRAALLALANGDEPDAFACPDSRHARTAVRVLCRQLARDTRIVVDEALLQRWRDACEPAEFGAMDDGAEHADDVA